MIEWLVALSPVAGLAVNSGSLLLLFRLRPAFGLLRAEYVGFLLGALAVLLLNALALMAGSSGAVEAVGQGTLALLSYSALGYCHFHFVNLGETARRIRLLRELTDAGGSLSHSELLRRYNAGEIIERRMKRLINSGQVVLRGQRYYISNRTVLRIATMIIVLKRLLLGKESEFEQGQ